jgi:hypothetical protein
MGKDAQVNEFVMNAREQLTETSLMDKRLWENGILSTKDFLRNNNNRTTGTASLINSFKTYNADYDRIVKGVEDKTLSRITLNRKAQVEKLFDMRTHAFVVNPTTGEPNIVKRDANGAPSSDPNDIVNSSVVDFLSTADVKYFNAQTTAKGIVDSLGQRLIRDGLGKTTKGAYLALDSAGEAAKAQLKSAREEAIDVALMGSNMASFLVDSGDYDTTTNKDEADKNDKLILENPDGTFEYDEKQKTEAKLRFDRLLESMIPRSEEKEKISETKTTKLGKVKAQTTILSKIQSGTKEERIIGASNIAGLAKNKNIVRITEYKDRLEILRANDKGETFTETISVPTSTAEFVKGASTLLTDITNINEALRQSGITGESIIDRETITDGTVLFERKTPPKPPSALEKFDAQLDAEFKTGVLGTGDDATSEENVEAKFAPLAAKYGVTIKVPYDFGEIIELSSGTGDSKNTEKFEIGKMSEQGIVDLIKGFIKNKKDLRERVLAVDSKGTSATGNSTGGNAR